jgi:hypothetical protein
VRSKDTRKQNSSSKVESEFPFDVIRELYRKPKLEELRSSMRGSTFSQYSLKILTGHKAYEQKKQLDTAFRSLLGLRRQKL